MTDCYRSRRKLVLISHGAVVAGGVGFGRLSGGCTVEAGARMAKTILLMIFGADQITEFFDSQIATRTLGGL